MDDAVVGGIGSSTRSHETTTGGAMLFNEEVPVEADEILSRAMHEASLQDRNAIHEEIHGVRCMAIQETPESVAKALHNFQVVLEKGNVVSKELKTTYNRILLERQKARSELLNVATTNQSNSRSNNKQSKRKMRRLEKNRSFCQHNYAIDDPAFRLRFLRCELFDVQKAVIRFCNYLNFVHELWGSVALEREVRLADFSRSETKLFRKGYFQLLPFRDRSGRRIVTLLGGTGQDVDYIERAKGIFYVWDAATRDSAESQKIGSILVMERYFWEDGIDGSFEFPKQDLRLMIQMVRSVPSRMVAVHICWPEAPVFRFLSKILAFHAFVGSNRLRLKLQVGDDLEMRYNLKSLGIPIQLTARTESGTIKVANHNAWMKIRRRLEGGRNGIPDDEIGWEVDKETIVECPLTNDIVFRQGTPYWNNPGNGLFRDLILDYWEKKQAMDEKSQTETPDPSLPPEGGSASSSISESNQGAATTNSYQQKGRTESDRHLDFRDWLIEEVHNRMNGRFLEWNKDLKSFVVVTDIVKIQKKVSVSIYNCRKKASAMMQMRKLAAGESENKPNPVPSAHDILDNSDSGCSDSNDDDSAYQFIEGGPPPVVECCFGTQEAVVPPASPTRKKQKVGIASYRSSKSNSSSSGGSKTDAVDASVRSNTTASAEDANVNEKIV